MKQLTLLFVFALFIISCENESDLSSSLSDEEKLELLVSNPDKELTFAPLTKKEVELYLSGHNQINANVRGSAPNGDVTTTSELIIICQGCGSSSESCFGVWGTNSCDDVNCNDGCCCYD